jgi:ribosomal protein S18 acetylase RimI-like enzyme
MNTNATGALIRQMTADDIPAGLLLCRASGWNQTEPDWQVFLSAASPGALVAEQNGSVIGTVATLPYGPFAWISMVLVDPHARGRGVGTLLLERGLDLIPHGVTARLDATPAGEVLYRQLGFEGEYRLARWFRDGARNQNHRPRVANRTSAVGASSVRRLNPRDWPAILDLDRQVFGASRSALLERLARDAPEYAWVLERDGTGLRGFLFGRHGHVREHLGPLVTDDQESARVLLGASLASHPHQDFFIDVPDAQRTWTDTLTRAGFAIERPFLRMYRGRLTAPGEPSRIFAITGPEFG